MSKRVKAKQLSKKHLKCNKPRKTPSHKTKSHVVKACEDGKEKLIRFGQQGVKGAGKNLINFSSPFLHAFTTWDLVL